MSNLVPVAEALEALFALVAPLETEEVPLITAAGRVLAHDAVAARTQPPFAASAMDGYAVRAEDGAAGLTLDVVGESAAGHGWDGIVHPGQAVRIFTGAPVPEDAGTVVIQEDVTRSGDRITLVETTAPGANIRPEGNDFKIGDRMSAPRVLSPADVALAASMNLPMLSVYRRPRVALIATGDELVMPGETPAPDQIIASNSFGLKALFESAGAEVRLLPIAPDTSEGLAAVLDLAGDADMVVTIGGASVGDHDLVARVAGDLGLERAFYKIAMRPGKPLMCGRFGAALLIGLPGNPVSSMVCGTLFVVPALRALQGLPAEARAQRAGKLARPLGKNGPREHYMRAQLTWRDSIAWIDPAPRQDSGLMSVLALADCLLVRAPHADPAAEGADVAYIPL
ncbi:gephyrin-like molybdotransferase Glp [Dinoroseobacter sp. S124A]|uniref:molybdopterin molybdotransferase MoeA n=1 Tax=Dinoroseobacter sp. S124A TaxID=3415128 RepID=UPI003C7E2386